MIRRSGESLVIVGVGLLATAVAAGCGSKAAGPTSSATAHTPVAVVRTLPVDDQREHPLPVGMWKTQPGFSVPVRWQVAVPGWFGAHRSSDLSWQLRYGSAIGPDQLADILEVDLVSDAPTGVIRQLRQDGDLVVGHVGHETLGAHPATTVEVSFRRKTTLDVIGGFNVDKGEFARFHLIGLGSQTLVIDQDAPSRKRFAQFAPTAARLLASMRIS